MITLTETVHCGEAKFTLDFNGDALRSLGAVSIAGIPLRNPATRFLPWMDTYDGLLFEQFRVQNITTHGETTTIALHAQGRQDYPFRERRDSSGDLCFRDCNWDADPVTASLQIMLKPVNDVIDGRAFTGFKYWYEYASATTPIHRLIDRQTWEVGGTLDGLTLCLRNWLTPPRVRLGQDVTYSTVGLDDWANLLPGNLWARWTLLPPFDLQYGPAGVLLGRFDEVSLIRTVIETQAGEDSLRCVDLHLFEQTMTVRTNPKTIIWSPDVLDDVDALNLWTRLQDREQEKACRQFNIRREAPPAITFAHNVWVGMRFDTTYEDVIGEAADFGAEYVFIDPVWEHMEAWKETIEAWMPEEQRRGSIYEKFQHSTMCETLDFEVAALLGGEAGLKALCDRAQAKGVRLLSWIAAHHSCKTTLRYANPELGYGDLKLFAARESGRHPDSGYPGEIWTDNLNAPIMEHLLAQWRGVCERTGLAGYLWDSFSNMGWWQLDYSNGTMRPQFDRMAAMYADLTNAGLYIMPEALCAFSNHSSLGLFGGEIYAGDLLGYSYNSVIALHPEPNSNEPLDWAILRGTQPIDALFHALAHKRVPATEMWKVPHAERDPYAVAQVRALYTIFKRVRPQMQRRTVLNDAAGVRWDAEDGTQLLFSFKDQVLPEINGHLEKNRVYRITHDMTAIPVDQHVQ